MFEFIINKITGFIAEFGYIACLTVALGGHLAYICGFKNGAKYTTFSTIIYTIIASFTGAVK